MRSKMFDIQIFFWGALVLFLSSSIAPAQTDSSALTIKSETTENSADIHLKEEATEDEKKMIKREEG